MKKKLPGVCGLAFPLWMGLPWVGQASLLVLGGSCTWIGLLLGWGVLSDLSSIDQEPKTISGFCPPGTKTLPDSDRHPHLAVPLPSPHR